MALLVAAQQRKRSVVAQQSGSRKYQRIGCVILRERRFLSVAVLGLVLLDLAALDDITTGVEPHFYAEYAMLAVSVPLLGWLVRRCVSVPRRGSSRS